MGIIGTIIYFGICYAVGVFAEERGRTKFGWTLGSVLISPLVCFILLLILGKNREA